MSSRTNPTKNHEVSLDTRTQAQKFEDAARELGVNEDADTFKAKLAVIARQKVKDEPGPPLEKLDQ